MSEARFGEVWLGRAALRVAAALALAAGSAGAGLVASDARHRWSSPGWLDGADAASVTGGNGRSPGPVPSGSGIDNLPANERVPAEREEVSCADVGGAGAESLWDESLPVEVQGAAGGSGGAGRAAERSGAAGADRAALARSSSRPGGRDDGGRPTIAMETYVRLMVLKQRYRLGLSDAGGGGVGLDPSAAVLPDRADGAGAGRVDGAQAHAPARAPRRWRRSTRALIAKATRGEALPAAGGADRLDRDRGRHQVPDRRRPGVGTA